MNNLEHPAAWMDTRVTNIIGVAPTSATRRLGRLVRQCRSNVQVAGVESGQDAHLSPHRGGFGLMPDSVDPVGGIGCQLNYLIP